MAKLPFGIDGDVIGLVGNHVGRRVKGENILSKRPAKSEKAPTALQLDQRLKFGLFTSWLSGVTPVLNIGFKDQDAHMSPYNAAVSYNIEHALTGVSPNYSIDYLKTKFSKGKLRRPTDTSANSLVDAEMEYEWKNVTGLNGAMGTDQIGLVVYNVEQKEFLWLMNAALRSAEAYTLQLPLDWAGDTVHSWMLAVSADGKLVSSSTYIGQNIVL